MRAPRVRAIGATLRSLALLGAALWVPGTSSAQESGRVAGRATQSESGQSLVGASVSVEGSTLSTITDAEGRFLLSRVPVGSHTLVLTFIGREPQTRQVSVTVGQTTTVELGAPVAAVALKGLTVLGPRALVQAEALSRQKNAAHIMNIVASDQMGRFPDSNAPEAVQRMPGVAIARDQGEGRYIQIRGGSAANTQVMFNGVQIPSPEGDVRQIALDAVPVDILESIEVSKAVLPSMDADAIGGAVNLVTRRAPFGRVASIELAGGFAPLREEPAGSGSVTLGDRVGDGRLGYLLNGSWSRRSFGSDDVEPAWDLGGAGASDDALEELELRHYSLSRERMGGTASLDYRISETSSIGFTGIATNLEDTEQRRTLLSAIPDDALEWLHKNREENLRTYSAALRGEHLLGSVSLDYHAAWTRSLEHTPFDTEIAWVRDGVGFAPSISDPDDIRSNPSTLAGDYLFDVIEPASSDTEDTDVVGGIDLALPFGLGSGAGMLKVGMKIRDKTKTQEVTEEEYELAGGDVVLGTDYGEAFGQSLRYPGEYSLPAFGTSPDQVTGFIPAYQSQLDSESNVEADTEDYDLDERVTAAYVMAELNVTPSFLLVPGIRYEQTRVVTNGFDFDAATETLSPVTAEHDYGQLFPMIQARWSAGPRTNVRAAFTSTIQRPNFFDLVPYRVRDDPDLVLGNPDLEPTLARSFDLLFERYDSRIGVMSAGVFYKRLTDPIFVFVEDNTDGGETEQPRNGESGWIRGVEVALQRSLFAGFGIYGNYTHTDSEAELPTGRTVRLQGQSDHVFNVALSYERSAFSSQVSVNYHNDYVDEYADEEQEDVYIDNHLQLDLTASYQVTPRGRVFLELVNLTNEPLVAYQGVRERPIQMEYYQPWGRLGVRYTW